MVEDRRDSEQGSPDDSNLPGTLQTACFGNDNLDTKNNPSDN